MRFGLSLQVAHVLAVNVQSDFLGPGANLQLMNCLLVSVIQSNLRSHALSSLASIYAQCLKDENFTTLFFQIT